MSEELIPQWERIATTGPESVELRRAIRDQEKVVSRDTRSEIGFQQLAYWKHLQHMQGLDSVRSSIAQEGQPTESIMVSKARESFERSWKSLTRFLHETARTRPDVLRSFFRTVERIPNFDKLEPALVESYLYDPEDTEMQELIREQAEQMRAEGDTRPDDELLAAAKQKRVSAEIVDVLCQAYREGDETLPAVLMPIIEQRAKELDQNASEMRAELSHLLPEIRKTLQLAIADGTLPISQELLDERFNNLSFEVIDPLSADLEEIGGSYETNTHQVFLDASLPAAERESVVLHEVLHGLSGQTSFILHDEMPDVVMTEETRSGLHFSAQTFREDVSQPKERALDLRWLNEAVTESLTIELSKKTEGAAYKNERQLLALLTGEGGVPKETVVRAYFENTPAQAQADQRSNPDVRALFRQSNEQFGQRFLVNLDHFIAAHDRNKKGLGVLTALTKWQEHGGAFPSYLTAWRSRESKRTA